MASISDPRPKSNIRAFPSSRTVAVVVEREADGLGWIVRANNDHAWLYSGFSEALADACDLANGFKVVVISSAGVVS